jgi:hypothetical protein
MDNGSTTIRVPGFFRGKTVKTLTFALEGLTIERPLSFDPVVFIPAGNIAAFRYGVKWLQGYAATIGRQYVIEIRDNDGNITDIKLRSVYRIKAKVYGDLWSAIFAQLWSHYFYNQLVYYFDLYRKNQSFELAGLKFFSSGVQLDNVGLLWDEFELSNYKTYFVLHHKSDLKKKKNFDFLNDVECTFAAGTIKSNYKRSAKRFY